MSREAWIAAAVIVGVIGLLTLWGAIKLVIKLVAKKRMLGDMGWGGKLAFFGSILYTIFPIDLLPDPIYLDDMAVLGLALFYLNRLLRKKSGLPQLPPPGHGRVAPPGKVGQRR